MAFLPETQSNKTRADNVLRVLIKICLICIVIVSCIAVMKYAFDFGRKYAVDSEDKNETVGQAIKIKFQNGCSTEDIAKILKENGLIKYPILFKAVSKINNNDGQYKAGEHEFNVGMDYESMMKELKKNVNKKETVRFTIPEGFELRQIAKTLGDKKLVDENKFMEVVQNGNFNYSFLEKLPKRENKLEGYLFPDTYEIYADASEEDIIKKMLNRFDEIFTDEYINRAKELNMSMDQIVTLASIIEREAKLDNERPIISGVFHNRLKSKKYPLLQSCATVQYVLGERKEILSDKDTKIDSPYNTYIHEGLPPGPIASPGKASIEAALYPEKTDYNFFVANKDGSHIFSKTFNEHQAAIRKAQRSN